MPTFVKSYTCRLLSLAAFAFLLSTLTAHGQTQLDNASVLKLHTAGLGDDVIVTTINSSPGHYALSTDDLISLKRAGISDSIVSAMLRKNSGAGTPVATASKTTGADSSAAIPPGVTDAGVYYQDGTGQYQEINPEIVNYKSGGVLKGLASGGIIKGDLNGNINGRTSKLPLSSPITIVIYTLEGQSPNEYQLLRMHQNSNSREFRSKTGGIVHQSTGANRDALGFDPKKLGPHVYQFTLPADVGKGEYGLLPPVTANSQGNAASAGKIYTFTLVE